MCLALGDVYCAVQKKYVALALVDTSANKTLHVSTRRGSHLEEGFLPFKEYQICREEDSVSAK